MEAKKNPTTRFKQEIAGAINWGDEEVESLRGEREREVDENVR